MSKKTRKPDKQHNLEKKENTKTPQKLKGEMPQKSFFKKLNF
jgi:hypothetical protein